MKTDDDSLDATLDRYIGKASAPPAGQVESSVDAVWERLRLDAEYATVPSREIVTRRSPFTIAAAVLIATVVIGLYAAQRRGLLLQQPGLPELSSAIQSQTTSVNSAPPPEAATNGAPAPSGGAAAEVARPALPAMPTRKIDGKYSRGRITTAPLAFKAASIRQTPSPREPEEGPWTNSNGRFRAENADVRSLIGWTYGVFQVKGGPDWIELERYDFDARPGNPEVGPERVRVMLQTLLEERFKLRVHRETEQPEETDLVTALREQLGLELQATKRQVEVVVIDRIERPSEN